MSSACLIAVCLIADRWGERRLVSFYRAAAGPNTGEQLSAAQVALGDAKRARESAEAALALDAKNALSHERLADALAELADFMDAREE